MLKVLLISFKLTSLLCPGPIPRRLMSKLGVKAKIPEAQKLSSPTLKTKPSNEPSKLLGYLKAIPEAIVGMTAAIFSSS